MKPHHIDSQRRQFLSQSIDFPMCISVKYSGCNQIDSEPADGFSVFEYEIAVFYLEPSIFSRRFMI